MFQKFKDLYHLQKQSKLIKKELANTHIEANVEGIVVIISGTQEVVSVDIPESYNGNFKKLSQNLIKAFNKALEKSQKIAADKMKPLMGEMGMPGMQ